MQPLERLVNLVALLLDSRRPMTFEEIRERMPGAYEQSDLDTAKRMFERDKDILRDIGIPIEVVATDVWDAEQGYTIPKDEYYLPEITFTAEEISALFVAARTGGQDTSAEEAVRKLLYGAEGAILAGSSHCRPTEDRPTPVSPPRPRRSPNVAAFASPTERPEGRDPSDTSIRTVSCSGSATGTSSGWIMTAASCGRSASPGSRPTS